MSRKDCKREKGRKKSPSVLPAPCAPERPARLRLALQDVPREQKREMETAKEAELSIFYNMSSGVLFVCVFQD